MIQQHNGKSVRMTEYHNNDISFLHQYYEQNGHFPLFQQVLIETRTDCNGNCPFCPHTFNNKPLGVMTWECFTTIIDQLIEIQYSGRLALMVSNEPLLEDRLVEMVRYIKNHSPRMFLDITSNGRLLTLEKADELFATGLDNLNVNDYRSDRDKNPAGITENVRLVAEAYENNPKLTIQFRRIDERLPNYGGNIPQSFDKSEFGFCNFPFRKIVVAYNGDVLLCCNDFLYSTEFGNVMKKRIDECWHDRRFNNVRLALLQKRRIGLCAQCNDVQDYDVFG